MSGPKILVLDIETMPAKTEQFSLREQYTPIERVIEPGYVFGIGYMWHGTNRTDWVQVPNVATAAYELLDEADIVVTWNGDRFDIPHLQTEILKAGLTPPSPFKSVDVWKTCNKRLYLESSKLDYAARIFLGEHKIKTDYSLWRGCMDGDEQAIRRMARYCRQDVRLTDRLYVKFLPLIKNHPHVGLWVEDENNRICPNCGGSDLHRRGWHVQVSMRYPRYCCNTCGAWPRGAKGERIDSELRASV